MSAPARARVTPTPSQDRSSWTVGGLLLIVLALLLYTVAWSRGEDTARGLVVGPLVAIVCVPLFLRIRDSGRTFDLAGILVAALGAKLVGAYARFWMVDSLYNGVGDSSQYDFWGRQFAPMLRSFDFGLDSPRPIPGTGWLDLLAGIVYAIFGSDRFTGFIIFAMLALVGCWFFYRAVEIAIPHADHKRYAMLVFFWPSLVFWPSAIGKEAWMIFSLGLASLGAAKVFDHRPNGYVVLALGIAGATLPRPHIAIVVLAAAATGFFVATLFGRGSGVAGLFTRMFGVLFLVVAGALLAPRVATFLNIDDVGGSGFTDSLDEVQRRTSQGGSGFTPAEISTPLDYPWAFVTVLFRPFPFEVSSAATAISALEGLLLLSLLVVSARRIARLPATLIRNGYAAYAAAFAFMFVYVFAFIGNFGILARQRVQLLPFLFVLIAMSATKTAPEPKPQANARAAPNGTRPPVPHRRAPALAPPRRQP